MFSLPYIFQKIYPKKKKDKKRHFEKNQRWVDTDITVVPISYKATPIKDHSSYQTRFQLIKYYYIVLLKRGHPSYNATFSLQKGKPYKRGSTVLLNTVNSLTLYYNVLCFQPIVFEMFIQSEIYKGYNSNYIMFPVALPPLVTHL